MLLTLLINVCRLFTKLKPLCGWRSDSAGFNQNLYAMTKMGKIFSGSFVVIIIFNFLIVLLNGGSYLGEGLKDFSVFDSVLAKNMFISNMANMVLIVIVGLVFHFFFGLIGAGLNRFNLQRVDENNYDKQFHFEHTADTIFLRRNTQISIEEGVGVHEEKCVKGYFGAFFRNLLQVAVALMIPYLLLKVSVLDVFVKDLLGEPVESKPEMIFAVLQAVIVLCWLVLIKHATGVTEYGFWGIVEPGMKNYTIFIFGTLAAGAAMYFLNMDAFEGEKATCAFVLIGISLVMFVIQVFMRNVPSFYGHDAEDLKDVEFDVNGWPVSGFDGMENPYITNDASFLGDTWYFYE